MALQPKSVPQDQSRASVWLLMAAAALFVLIAGLTLLTCLILVWERGAHEATVAFVPFFLTGLVLFAASAMIDTEMLKAFLGAVTPLKGSK